MNDAPAAVGLDLFRCPEDGGLLAQDDGALVCPGGHRWPLVRGIPRFVPGDAYVDSFSFEWNTHHSTQLDSRTGGDSSERILREKTGLTPGQVAGKLVLDAGVGAGRFSDVLARWGARVVGVDLSYAVEASARTFADLPQVRIAQADIARLPFAPETFDVIISIGVLHHTSDTRRHFERLVPLVKPGGELCVWVYPDEGDYPIRQRWTPFVSRIPSSWFHDWCQVFVPLAQRHRDNPVVQLIAQVFPWSEQGLGLENDVLDTFDGYSPRYHWTHGREEVEGWFRAAGLEDVRSFAWPTSVRGRRPM